MVNASLNWASIVGIALAICSGCLFFSRSFKPDLSTGYDPLLGAIGLLCGGILFFQGWRLDPILQLHQAFLAGTVVFFAYENIKLRNRLLKLKSQNTNNYSKKNYSVSKEKKYCRNIGLYEHEDLEVMDDNQIYEIVKLELLGITSGEIIPELGEVEYLKNILNNLKRTK